MSDTLFNVDTIVHPKNVEIDEDKIDDSIINVSTINKVVNGVFKDTVIFREYDDTMINIKYKEIICIENDDIESFIMVYNEVQPKNNIVLDSRLNVLIWYYITQNDDILIYDSSSHKTLTLYKYLPQHFYISSYELSLKKIKVFFMIKLTLSFLFNHLNINWSVSKVVEELKKSCADLEYKMFIYTLLNTIGVKRRDEINDENVKNIKILLKNAFNGNYKNEMQDNVLRKCNEYELYYAIGLLRDDISYD